MLFSRCLLLSFFLKEEKQRSYLFFCCCNIVAFDDVAFCVYCNKTRVTFTKHSSWMVGWLGKNTASKNENEKRVERCTIISS
jgi:hypothetical protein